MQGGPLHYFFDIILKSQKLSKNRERFPIRYNAAKDKECKQQRMLDRYGNQRFLKCKAEQVSFFLYASRIMVISKVTIYTVCKLKINREIRKICRDQRRKKSHKKTAAQVPAILFMYYALQRRFVFWRPAISLLQIQFIE